MATRFEHLLPALARLATEHRPVPLGQVGSDACLSASRAQRVFTDIVGESPKQYPRRVRLERAAAMLLGSEARIIDVALASGFESHEAFTRAFGEKFGMPPSNYRRSHPGSRPTESMLVAMATAPCVGLYRKPLYPQEIPMTEYDVERRTVEAIPVLFGARKLDRDKVAEGLAEVLPAAFGHAMAEGLAMVGPPFVRYVDQSAAFVTIEAGVPLESAAPDPGTDSGLAVGELPSGEVAFTRHVGPYDTLGDAHAALDRWVNENGCAVAGAPWEVYITDPAEVPDPAAWVTEVYQPITS